MQITYETDALEVCIPKIRKKIALRSSEVTIGQKYRKKGEKVEISIFAERWEIGHQKF